MTEKLHPYVVFLPSTEKNKILRSIFGSRAAVDILKYALDQGISNEIYQKTLVSKLSYSNKTIIENLKTLTKLAVLSENMKKSERNGRIIWVKTYQLSDVGRWFALLLAEEKDLSESEKAEILKNIFRTYIKWVKELSESLRVDPSLLKEIFSDEMR